MHLLAIVYHPRNVSRSKPWVEEAVKARRAVQGNVSQDIFHSDDHFAICVQTEVPSNSRTGTVGADK
jgi:hypothetical protein